MDGSDTTNAHPPTPYVYADTIEWLKRSDLSSVLTGVSWVPSVENFDLDAVVTDGWLAAWLGGDDGAAALSAAKTINRWMFMDEVMKSGDGSTSASPGIHLLILKSLLPVTTAGATFIDAGCGTGYLMAAWLMMAGVNSRAIGLELDEKTARDTCRRLAAPDAVGNGQKCPAGARITIKVVDALAPDATALGVEEGSVDAINVGLAVEEPPAALVKLLRVGGLMTVPLIQAAQPEGIDDDDAATCFQVLRKGADGTLGPVDGAARVSASFTRGIQAPRETRAGAASQEPPSATNEEEDLRRRAALLRFRIGDEVECALSEDCWASGTIIALMYSDATMPPGLVAPYQVRLDNNGKLVYAPEDCDELIRRRTPKPEAMSEAISEAIGREVSREAVSSRRGATLLMPLLYIAGAMLCAVSAVLFTPRRGAATQAGEVDGFDA